MNIVEQIAQLRSLSIDSYFTEHAWLERGVNPSPQDVQQRLKKAVREFLDGLLEFEPSSIERLSYIQIEPLFDKLQQRIELEDTEDREMVSDVAEGIVHQISTAIHNPYAARNRSGEIKKVVIGCPQCTSRLRVPVMSAEIVVNCPTCEKRFPVLDGELVS